MGLFQKKSDEKKGSEEVAKTTEKQQNEHTVRERKIWNLKNIFIAFWIFVLFVAIAIIFVAFVASDFTTRVLLWTVLTIIYAVILFFLLEPTKLREIEKKEYRTVEKPVYRDVIKEVEKPVYRDIIKTVEKPVYRDVIKTVEKPVIKEVEKAVYYPVSKPKLEIKRYAFVGSKLTHIYHKSSCRLGKSIKKKYKAYADDEKTFLSDKYHPCKICVLKERKV